MDFREHSYYPPSIVQDHARRVLVLYPEEPDEIILPAKYEVCPDCEGRGQYVNPAIDSHGLSADDFAEDPDFAEDYFHGTYDITCRSCHGRNVILVPSTEEGERQVGEILQEEANYRAEVAAEQRACGYY